MANKSEFLRIWQQFAASAMQGLISGTSPPLNKEIVARQAAEYAHKMMEHYRELHDHLLQVPVESSTPKPTSDPVRVIVEAVRRRTGDTVSGEGIYEDVGYIAYFADRPEKRPLSQSMVDAIGSLVWEKNPVIKVDTSLLESLDFSPKPLIEERRKKDAQVWCLVPPDYPLVKTDQLA